MDDKESELDTEFVQFQSNDDEGHGPGRKRTPCSLRAAFEFGRLLNQLRWNLRVYLVTLHSGAGKTVEALLPAISESLLGLFECPTRATELATEMRRRFVGLLDWCHNPEGWAEERYQLLKEKANDSGDFRDRLVEFEAAVADCLSRNLSLLSDDILKLPSAFIAAVKLGEWIDRAERPENCPTSLFVQETIHRDYVQFLAQLEKRLQRVIDKWQDFNELDKYTGPKSDFRLRPDFPRSSYEPELGWDGAVTQLATNLGLRIPSIAGISDQSNEKRAAILGCSAAIGTPL